MHSVNLVAIPSRPARIIQKVAPGPPEINGHTDAGNIAKPHGSRQGRRQGLEWRYLAGILGIEIIAPDKLDRMFETAKLDKAEVECADHRREHQPAHDKREVGAENRHRIKDGTDNRIGYRRDGVADRLIDPARLRPNRAGCQRETGASHENGFEHLGLPPSCSRDSLSALAVTTGWQLVRAPPTRKSTRDVPGP